MGPQLLEARRAGRRRRMGWAAQLGRSVWAAATSGVQRVGAYCVATRTASLIVSVLVTYCTHACLLLSSCRPTFLSTTMLSIRVKSYSESLTHSAPRLKLCVGPGGSTSHGYNV